MSDKQSLPTGLQLTAIDSVFRERPHEYLDRLRTEDPVHCDVELGRLLLTRFEDARSVEVPPQARMREISRRTLASSSFSSRRCFTRSPILTMPFSSWSSITGR